MVTKTWVKDRLRLRQSVSDPMARFLEAEFAAQTPGVHHGQVCLSVQFRRMLTHGSAPTLAAFLIEATVVNQSRS
jgi:hypothetical protein